MKGGLKMINDKKGLSEVVTTLIIILLVLVAIGIVWVVVNKVLQSGTEQTEISAKCLLIDIKATAAQCTAAGICNVTYKRNAGGEDIDGVIIILSNGQSSAQEDIDGNVAPLSTETLLNFDSDLSPVPNKAEVAAYFIDDSGKQQLCGTTSAFEF
jgi:flagellin-like protein